MLLRPGTGWGCASFGGWMKDGHVVHLLDSHTTNQRRLQSILVFRVMDLTTASGHGGALQR